MTDDAQAADPTIVLKIVRSAKGFRVFPTRHDLANHPDGVLWEGSIEDFPSFAREASVTRLYLFDGTGPADPEDLEPSCDVGFQLDGMLHVFSTAERILGEETDSLVEAESPVAAYLREHRKDLVDESSRRARAEPDSGFGSGGAYEYHLRALLQERLGEGVRIPHFGDYDPSPIATLGRDVISEVRKLSEAAEKPVVEALYPKWLGFARTIGPSTLSQGDLTVFLEGEGQPLSQSARQRLWTQAKADLRSERTAAKLSRSRA